MPSPKRRERALQTRRRMLKAAYDLFCTHGYAATTMNAIADEAGVAVQTLYFTFHTKGAILAEVLGAAVLGIDRWTGPPPEPFDLSDTELLRRAHPWFARCEAQPDPEKALAIFLDEGGATMQRAAPLFAAIQAARSDPEVRRVHDVGERRRADGYGALVKVLAKKRGLRPGLTLARATDILLVTFSAGMYQALGERGWSHAERRRFFLDLLVQQLL